MNLHVTYNAKLGCGNCGMVTFYKLPRGQELLQFESKDDSNPLSEHSYSRLRHGIDDTIGKSRNLNCSNCAMPFLILERWEQAEINQEAQQ